MEVRIMKAPYWNQWSRTELLSWQGVELNDYQEDKEQKDEKQKECSCSNVCMICLGMSYSDFM